MLSVYSNLPKYRQVSYFGLNQPKWKLENLNDWLKCFLDKYISHIMCLRKQKKLFSSAETANKIQHLKSPLMLSVYHNLLYQSFFSKPLFSIYNCSTLLLIRLDKLFELYYHSKQFCEQISLIVSPLAESNHLSS